ncbi:MAG: DMT family transporter [Epulopiscium sp.]|nr:DMT family transporter [Candidatus Epulonipiscium sp.]
MIGIIISLISGALMSIQGVFNTRVTESAGLWLTNTIVQGSAFLVCLIALALTKDGNINGLRDVNKLYLLGGVLGAGITYTVIKGIDSLGPAYAIMLILIAQMSLAYLIELFGWFGSKSPGFEWHKLIGVAFMIGGIVVFQWKK